MSTKEQLIEQHIREYESRLKHIDELYQRAQQATGHLDSEHASREQLRQLGDQRDQLEQKTGQVKALPMDKLRHEIVRSAGPMAIWDILAQKLEDFVERHE